MVASVNVVASVNGFAHGFRLEDDAHAPLRADAFADGDGELVLGMILAGGRPALELANTSGLRLQDFYRQAQRAVYHAVVATPEDASYFLPEDVLDHMARDGRVPPEERPLRRDLEDWRARGETWELLPGYVRRLHQARRERRLEQRLARAQALLEAGKIDEAEALLAGPDPTSAPIGESAVAGEVECTGAALLASPDEPVRTSLPCLGQSGYFSRGWGHLVAGYPRVGKTEFLARVVPEWVAAGETVLWLTEEPRSIWKERLLGLPGDWSKVTLRWALGEQPAVLRHRAVTGTETVVIWDTLRNLLQPEDETNNSELARLINPIVAEMRRAGKTLVMGHHDTKGLAEHGKGVAGGHALLACFDAPMEIHFDGANKTRRVIESHARLKRPPELVYELQGDGTMKALGDPAGAELAAVAGRCADVVEADWLKSVEVWRALGDPRPSEEQVRRALLLLARQGALERDPPISFEDVRGKTVRWAKHGTSPPTSPPTIESLVGGEVSGGRR